MTSVTLYFSPNACSLAPHIALEEAGATIDSKPLALKKGDQRQPAFLALNPKGKVPLLVVNGETLTENVAILPYIADLYPAANLLPVKTPMERAQALSKLAFLASGVHTVIGRFFGPQRVSDMPGSEASVLKLAAEQTAAAFKIIDGWLAGREWVLDSFSVIDAYLFVFMHWAKALKLDLSDSPNYAAHYDRVIARPAVKRVLEREAQAAAAQAA
jgi:glutathione S-transferase